MGGTFPFSCSFSELPVEECGCREIRECTLKWQVLLGDGWLVGNSDSQPWGC